MNTRRIDQTNAQELPHLVNLRYLIFVLLGLKILINVCFAKIVEVEISKVGANLKHISKYFFELINYLSCLNYHGFRLFLKRSASSRKITAETIVTNVRSQKDS
jgi:hypothetical protein